MTWCTEPTSAGRCPTLPASACATATMTNRRPSSAGASQVSLMGFAFPVCTCLLQVYCQDMFKGKLREVKLSGKITLNLDCPVAVVVVVVMALTTDIDNLNHGNIFIISR